MLEIIGRRLSILLPFVLTATAVASPTINSCTVTWCNLAETCLVLAVFVIWLTAAGVAKLSLLASYVIISIDSDACLLIRLTSAVRRFVCFSPAFILDCAVRGPPHLLQENL